MAFLVLAGATVVLHFAFVAFVLLGALLVRRRPRLAWLHLPAVLWAAWVELAGVVCPLTPLEGWLRARAGRAGYQGGFVEHYLLPVLYPSGLTTDVQWLLGGIVLAVNAAAYGLILSRRRPMG